MVVAENSVSSFLYWPLHTLLVAADIPQREERKEKGTKTEATVWLVTNLRSKHSITRRVLLVLQTKRKVQVLVAQSCPTFCNTTDCSLPAPPVQGILRQALLEWVAVLLPRGLSRPRD